MCHLKTLFILLFNCTVYSFDENNCLKINILILKFKMLFGKNFEI